MTITTQLGDGGFTAWVDDPALSCTLTLGVRRTETGIRLRSLLFSERPGHDPIASTDLRIPISTYVDMAARKVYGDEMRAPIEQTGQRHKRASMAGQLPRVVELYLQALGASTRDRYRPTAAVARELGVSRGHAARMVVAARESGLLGPTTPGRASA